MNSNIKALIFDLDGTVADTIWAIRNAINDVRATLGMEPLDYDGVKAGVNNGARNLVIAVIVPPEKRNDDEYIDHALKLYIEAYARTYVETDTPYDGMREALLTLKARGYRMGMLSNKPDAFVRVIASKLFGDDMFEVARGPVSDIVKPDARLTNEIISLLDERLTPEECVMIGDSDVDVATGKNAGMKTMSVTWGYRSRAFLEQLSPDYIIDAPAELTEIFQ